MAIQLSVPVRNARLDAFETVTGASPRLQLRTGAPPANCAAAATGTLLADIDLPADWMNAASGGQKTLNGIWDAAGAAAGNAGHFRIVDAGGSTCHMQGTVTATGGGGDMTLSNINIAVGQPVEITSFTLTDGNA